MAVKINASGRSMVEMLGVLAIFGLLSVIGISGFSKAMTKYKITKLTDDIAMIVANTRTRYSQQNDYEGLNNASAISIGLVPNEMVKYNEDGTLEGIVNAYNGKVWISAAKANNADTDKKSFVISFNSLSREACMALATNDWGSAYSSGIIALRADNGSIGNSDAEAAEIMENANYNEGCDGATSPYIACPGGKNLAIPMPPLIAVQACSCKGNECAVIFKYHH
ncbi:MAG: hypothetical protein MR350_05220 [Alphaproteobacteria bacterium]|nr:hypothetical protein [Alphaproteobacteria bacterium]